MPLPLITTYLESMNKEVLNKLDLVRKTVDHPGESGDARENVLREFFRKLVPRRFGIDSGFVIDAKGRKSRQVDIIIYHDEYHPIFEIEGVKHFMVESVAVVIEVKASIESKEDLGAALSNIKSVKQLDRTDAGKNYSLRGSERGPMIDPENFQHQVFGAIITEMSLNRGTLASELLAYLRSNPKRYWPNWYADIRHFSVLYSGGTGTPGNVIPTDDPYEAKHLVMTEGLVDRVSPLAELAENIISFLRIAPTIDFSPMDYMKMPLGNIEYWSLGK